VQLPRTGIAIAILDGLVMEGTVTIHQRSVRSGAATLGLVALGALAGCSSLGGLGSVLGGGGSSSGYGSDQVSGTVLGVDQRARQVGLRLSNGQTLVLAYDGQTQVIYQNERYAVPALERGDQVTARVQSDGNTYYTDLMRVDRSVSGAGDGWSNGWGNGLGSNAQMLEGTVRQVDRSNGLFTMDVNNRVRVLVSLPSALSRSDIYRFQRLRPGQFVRMYGVFVTRSRVELQQFY
jgi:hypothetical protein